MKNAGLRAPRRCVARRRVHPDAPAMTSRSSTRRGQCSSPIPRPQSPPSLRGPGSGSAPSAVATRAKRNSCESWPETVSFATSPSSKGFGRRPRPWTVYAECLTRVLEGGGQALAQRLAGALTHAGPGRTCAARSQAGPGASPDCPAPGGAAQGRELERHPPSRVTERHRTAWRQQRVTRCAAATSLCFFRHCVPQAPRRSPDVPPTQPRSRHAGGPSADAHTRAMTPPTFSGISPSDHRCRSSKKYTEELVGLDAADLTEADTIGHCPSLRDLVEQKKTDAPSTVLAIMTLARCLRCRSSGDRCSVGPDGSRRARDRRSRTPEAGCRQ